MSDTRKKEIIMATLELAANKGLGNVSMNMIADKVGIKKPSLYNHFASKEELVEAMYQFLREEAKKNANVGAIDYTVIFAGKSALEVLRMMVGGYFNMNQQEHMLNFYKVIYSERSIQPMAAKILAEETEKMIIATKQLFYACLLYTSSRLKIKLQYQDLKSVFIESISVNTDFCWRRGKLV